MAFKRSAVRSRLSPPQNVLNSSEFRAFSLFLALKSPVFTPLVAGVQHFDRNLTGISFRLSSPYSLFCLADTKGLVKSLCGFLTDRTLDMKIMFCHVGVRMADHRLDRLDVHTQCLHLADVGMAAAVGR